MSDSKGKGKADQNLEEAPSNPDPSSQGSEQRATSQESLDQPAASSSSQVSSGIAQKGDWQAIFSEQHNAYYFHNTKTKQTTWTNPLEGGKDAAKPKVKPVDTRAVLDGVDPALAYLDPTLSNKLLGPSGEIISSGAFSTDARFNMRTGKFEGNPDRNPEFVSEYNRMKRQSSFYYDMDAWQKEREADQARKAAGEVEEKRKPTKKELEFYKAKALEKKKLKLAAWMSSESRVAR